MSMVEKTTRIDQGFENVDGEECVVITKTERFVIPTYEHVVGRMPSGCMTCPVGLQRNCGRNVPWKEEDYYKRPKTCRLRTLEEYLSSIED